VVQDNPGGLFDFGCGADPHAALREYLRVNGDLQVGRVPTHYVLS
jgi:hypothetical protein